MSYAVIETGGTQFRVKKGEAVHVPTLPAEVGSTLEYTPLVISDGEKTVIGRPLVDEAKVHCSILEHGRGRKVIVFKFKRRKGYKRKKGHRQGYTKIHIDDITMA